MCDHYLIYHPARVISQIGNLKIHHDKFGGNEDPYLWNEQFIHSFCHITQMRNLIGQFNFWVSGDKYPNFNKLLCDCVFVVDQKLIWQNANNIERADPLIDSNQAFAFHYNWVNEPYNQHHFERKRRYTLKAKADVSFQPQDSTGNLIDILPVLENVGISKEVLIKGMTSSMGSRPFKITNEVGQRVYHFLDQNAQIKIYGRDLKDIHP